MNKSLKIFEKIARKASAFSEPKDISTSIHPFEVRDIHSSLPKKIRHLFDDGHYSQATFEAFKYLDNEIKRHSSIEKTGKILMMEAFKEHEPAIRLSALITETERNEQEGYKFILAGSMMAIRNPRGHEHNINDDINTCLDHLSLVSHLLRRLEKSGYISK